MQKKCPMCRSYVEYKSLYIHKTQTHQTTNTNNNDNNNINSNDKLLTMQEIIRTICRHPDSQILIFGCHIGSGSGYHYTSFTRNCLDEEKITYSEFNSTQHSRYTTYLKYHNKEIRVLYIDSFEDIAGLNLQNTTDIIFTDPFISKAQITQAIGRADRPGRPDNTNLTCHFFNYE